MNARVAGELGSGRCAHDDACTSPNKSSTLKSCVWVCGSGYGGFNMTYQECIEMFGRRDGPIFWAKSEPAWFEWGESGSAQGGTHGDGGDDSVCAAADGGGGISSDQSGDSLLAAAPAAAAAASVVDSGPATTVVTAAAATAATPTASTGCTPELEEPQTFTTRPQRSRRIL